MTSSGYMQKTTQGTVIEIVVQPKAGRNELVGIHGGSLKVRLTAPPVEGEANRECLRFLAKVLQIPKSRLEILKGHRSRRKTVLAREVTPEHLQNILKQLGIH
jgi:uncharacterized protein (TIGR00251 family)